MPSRKLHCLLCGGPVAYDGDPGRLQDHLRRDHEATASAGLDWVLAGSLMERGRREAVLAAILSNTAASGGGDSEQGDTSPGTKVILNIDISDDDQEDCSSGPAGTGSECFLNNSTEKDENMKEQVEGMTFQEESLHASKDLSDDTSMTAMSETRKNRMKSSWKEMKYGKDKGDDSDLIHKSMQGSVTVEEAVGDHEINRGTGDDPRKHIECEFCDFKADTNFKLRKHMKNVHSMSSFIKFAKSKDKKEESVQKTNVAADLQRKIDEFSKLLSGPPEDAEQCGDSSTQSNQPPHKKRRITFEKDEMLMEEDGKRSPAGTQKHKTPKKTSKSKNKALALKDKKITENLKLSAMKNKVEVQLKEICNSPPKDQNSLVDNSSVGRTEEDFEKLKKDFNNVGPSVNISGSVYFQFHKSVIKQLSKSSLKDFNMKTLQRDSNLPDNWFNIINYFDGCKRKVRDFMTPDRQVIRTKTGVIEYMKISNLYSEEEVSRVSNYLDTRQKKVK